MKVLYKLFASLLIAFYALTATLPFTIFAQTVGNGTLTATPSSGPAPLSVSFTATWLDVTKTYTINFGDGASQSATPQCALNNTTSKTTGCFFTVSHTYAKAGTYTATAAGYTTHVTVGGSAAAAATATGGKTPPTCQILLTNSAPSIYGVVGSPSLTINVGDSVTVMWSSTNATAGAITNIGNVGPQGSINLLPAANAVTTYFGAFTGPGGTANCQANVVLNPNLINGGSATVNQNTANSPSALGVTVPQASQSSSGLVPCGYGAYDPTGANSASSSTGCQACNLAQLIQNIMTFAIGIAIPIAAALFAYAGFLYITSASNPPNIGKAKSIFKDALIGFVIAITAWLVINTLLHVIFSQGTFSSGNWFTIECTTGSSRAVNNTITKVLSSLPIVAGNAGPIANTDGGISTAGLPSSSGTIDNGLGGSTCNSGFTYDGASGTCYNPTTDTIQYPSGTNSSGAGGTCPSGFTYDPNSGDSPTCYNPTTDTVQDPIPAGQQCPTGATYYPASASSGTLASCYDSTTDTVSDPLNATAMSTSGRRGVAQCADGNDNCSVPQLLSQGLTETQAQAMSCIAVTENAGGSFGNSGTGASGTFQITGTNWKQYAPAGCSAANFGGNLQAAQNNAQCNLQTAALMVQAQGYQPWTGICNQPSGCGNVSYGQPWNANARTCVSNYDSANLH